MSYFLQLLYGMADLFIIGQYEGAASTTAVSVGSQVMHMITVMIVGLAMGTTVSIGRAIGAQDHKKISAVIGNTVSLFMAVSVALMVVFLALVRPIVAVMSTPEEAVAGTTAYLTICFIGIPCSPPTTSSVPSSGEWAIPKAPCTSSPWPVWPTSPWTICSSAPWGWAPRCGAGHHPLPGHQRGGFPGGDPQAGDRHQAPPEGPPSRRGVLQQILKIGLPVAFQDGFIQIAFLVITIIANRRGLSDAAAVGIVEKVISFLFLVPSSMLSTVSALGAQNIGAGKHDRAARTLRYAILIATGFGFCVSILMQWIAEPVVGLFTTDAVVVVAGGQYIRGYIWDCLFAGIHFSFSGYFCAYGRSEISFLHNICAILLMRIPGVYLMSVLFPDTLLPMGLATVCGSVLSVLICVGAYLYLKRRGCFSGAAVQV